MALAGKWETILDFRAGTGVGNRQPQKEPHGVTPGRLFYCDVTRTLAASGLECIASFDALVQLRIKSNCLYQA
jgi:hypothetical protein